MLLSEDMVGVPLNLNLNPSPSQDLLLMLVDQKAKKGLSMLASVLDLGYLEEDRIAAT